MNPNRFAELIVKPASCSREELSEIAALAKKYPYSPVIKILAARITSLTGHPLKDRLLSRAAIATPDRGRLKIYMTSSDLFDRYEFVKPSGKPGEYSQIAPGSELPKWPESKGPGLKEAETPYMPEPMK